MKVCLVTKFSWNLSWFVLIYIQDFNLILMEVLYMADFSAISALSSLSEKDLYYQWMINNNSTSTMLNALSGNSSDSSNMNGMSGIVNAISSGYSSLGMAVHGFNPSQAGISEFQNSQGYTEKQNKLHEI